MKNITIEEMIDNTNITINTVSSNNHKKNENFNSGKTFDCDIIAITKGSYAYTIDKNTYTCKAGELFFVPPGCNFSGVALEKSAHYFCHFSICTPITLKPTGCLDKEIINVFLKGCKENSGFILKNAIKMILYKITLQSGATFLDNIPGGIKKAIEEINKNPRLNLTGEQLAKIANMNYSYFSRRFHEFIGTSPTKYRDNLRLEEAKRMILSGMTVKETAIELGFSDMFAFSKKFKQHFKVSPSKIKNIEI